MSRITSDSVSESVDLLQMLIAPPPPPPPSSTSRPAGPPRHVEDGIAAAAQRPRTEQTCYRACHACAEEQRYLQQQQQHPNQPHHQPQCVYCSCSQPRVDPRLQRADRDDTASIYFNPRGPVGPGAASCMWPRRAPPVKARESTLSAPRADVGGTSGSNCVVQAALPSSNRRRDDDAEDNDDYDDAAGKRTMSTSLSSRSSSQTRRLRSAADICRRARRAAIADCCLRCWPRRQRSANSAGVIGADPLHGNTTTDIDMQTTHGGHSESATADASVVKLGGKLSMRRGLRCTTRWNIDAERRRTIVLVVGFLVGLFLVSTALLTGFVLLWPSQRRRHSTSGTIMTSLAIHIQFIRGMHLLIRHTNFLYFLLILGIKSGVLGVENAQSRLLSIIHINYS